MRGEREGEKKGGMERWMDAGREEGIDGRRDSWREGGMMERWMDE